MSVRLPGGASRWLALLTLLLVFAASAGVREALSTRTEALRQTLAAAPSLSAAVQVASTWQSITDSLAGPNGDSPDQLTQQKAAEISGELRSDINQGVIRLGSPSTDWTALTSRENPVSPTPPGTRNTAVNVEVAYRQPLRQHVRLLSGQFPGTPQAAVGRIQLEGGSFYPNLQVLVTQQTAAQFGLKAGSTMKIPGPDLAETAQPSVITFTVSGIVAPDDPNSAFWTSDPTAVRPYLQQPLQSPPYWQGGVLTTGAEIMAVESDFGIAGVNVDWMYPLSVRDLVGSQAKTLDDALTGLSSRTLPLSSDISGLSTVLTTSSALGTQLKPFIAAAQAVDVLLWLLYVSLTLAGLVALLLAGRMVVLQRAGELTLLRARGAALGRLARIVAGEAALLCVPAALAGLALALLAVPAGGLQPAGWTGTWGPVLVVLLIALGGPALMAVWRNRPPRRRAAGRRRPRARIRPVAEVTLILAAVAGVLVLRQQGLQAGSGVNLYTSATPALIAIPAVIVMNRLYPLVLRWLLRAADRTAGAPAFLGLARASRSALTPALPAFALVVALTVAAFGGMVSAAVTAGQVAASWATAGADAVVTAKPGSPPLNVTAASAAAAAAIPGVTHAAAVDQSGWFTGAGIEVTVLAVDPAAYAALTTATPGYPALTASELTGPASPGAAHPVLASPAAAAALGKAPVSVATPGYKAVPIRVAGTVSATPALPATPGQPAPAFVILPASAVQPAVPQPSSQPAGKLLLTGSGIDHTRLDEFVRQRLPGGRAAYRSTVLAGLTGSPLPHGAVTVITWAVIAAAVLGLAVMLLELALGAADRDATLARLATMGLGEGQRVRVVALELLPAVIAAGLAAWACALVLPPLVRPVVDLSVFTNSGVPVPLVADVAAVALPLAGLIVLAAAALAIEIGNGRRRGVASALRVGG